MPQVARLNDPRAICLIGALGSMTAWLGLVGCSWTAPTGAVTGTVRFDGKPVAAGRLTLLCEGRGKPVFFADITNGGYRIDRAPVGHARVAVQAFATHSATGEAPAVPGGARPLPVPAGIPGTGRPIAGFPARYLTPATSGLTCEIKPGAHTQDFDLMP